MLRDALFTDGTNTYVKPMEPKSNEQVTLRFRTAKDDIDEVRLITDAGDVTMYKACTREHFDYYETTWVLGRKTFHYYFEIRKGEEVCYYNRSGVTDVVHEAFDFTIVPDFSTPDWAKGAVMYQIYTDRFCNGDPGNDVVSGEYYYIDRQVQHVDDWYEDVADYDVHRFYGGDLQGVIDKLDYLKDLGIEAIYFNPLFVSPSNHKYDAQDYDYIDPHLGAILDDGGDVLAGWDQDNRNATKFRERVASKRNLEATSDLFIKLVEELHARDMKIIIDGVFNHCGSFNKWMDRERVYEGREGYKTGAYIAADSPYHSFFYFKDESPDKWPFNEDYEGWWNHNTLPKLNYEQSKELEDYILRVAKKWVSPPYNADGWRLDVAADLGKTPEYNHAFWKRFRQAVKEANPNAIILAEHYGDASEWLKGDEWDSIMNYDAFMEPVTWFLTGMEKHSDRYQPELEGNADEFVSMMNRNMTNMLPSSQQIAMNQLSNHDHSRFLTRTNHKVGRVKELGPRAAEENVNEAVMREAVIMQMSWVGAPTLYYGDEAGLCGFTDPDNRRTYPWGRENMKLLHFHKDAIRIHRESEALKAGSLKMLTWRENVLAYGRFTEKESAVVIVNNGEAMQDVTVPVWQANVPACCQMKRLICSYENGYTTNEEIKQVEDGQLHVHMGARSAVIYSFASE